MHSYRKNKTHWKTDSRWTLNQQINIWSLTCLPSIQTIRKHNIQTQILVLMLSPRKYRHGQAINSIRRVPQLPRGSGIRGPGSWGVVSSWRGPRRIPRHAHRSASMKKAPRGFVTGSPSPPGHAGKCKNRWAKIFPETYKSKHLETFTFLRNQI